MDIRPEIEIEVPDTLKNEALVEYLHTHYKGILAAKEIKEVSEPLRKKSNLASRKAERKDNALQGAELEAGNEVFDIPF